MPCMVTWAQVWRGSRMWPCRCVVVEAAAQQATAAACMHLPPAVAQLLAGCF